MLTEAFCIPTARLRRKPSSQRGDTKSFFYPQEDNVTIKQISEVAGVSIDTVTRKVKEMYPEKVQKGKATTLVQKEAINVMSELRKKKFIEPTQNAEVLTQNAELVTRSDLASFGTAIVSEVIKKESK